MRLGTLLLVVGSFACGTDIPQYYPLPLEGVNASRPLRVFDSNDVSNDVVLTVASLQGLVAQTAPGLYILPRTSQTAFKDATSSTGHLTDTAGGQGVVRSSYEEWLSHIESQWSVPIAYTTSNLTVLVKDFITEISGYVVARSPSKPFASDEQSLAAALMYCGQARCIVATSPEVEWELFLLGLPQLANFTGYTMEDFFTVFPDALPASNPQCGVIQVQTKFPCLADYVTYSRCPSWFGPIDPIVSPVNASTSAIMARVSSSTVLIGWGVDEISTVAQLSFLGSGIHAADWAWNLATLGSFRLGGPVSRATLTGNPTPSSSPKHKVAFVMSDGDNVQWLLGGFQGPNWYGSKDRGRVPITWTISDGLQYLAAPALQGLLSKATPKDTFIGGVSGFSYFYPDLVPSTLLAQSALRSKGAALGPGIAQNVIGFSGLLDQATASMEDYFALNVNATALYMPVGGYCSLQGAGVKARLNNGLFLTPRYCLWSPEFFNVTSLAATINAEATKSSPTSFDGYTIVLVHVWSHTVSDVVRVVELLNASSVEVLPLYDLIESIRANVGA